MRADRGRAVEGPMATMEVCFQSRRRGVHSTTLATGPPSRPPGQAPPPPAPPYRLQA